MCSVARMWPLHPGWLQVWTTLQEVSQHLRPPTQTDPGAVWIQRQGESRWRPSCTSRPDAKGSSHAKVDICNWRSRDSKFCTEHFGETTDGRSTHCYSATSWRTAAPERHGWLQACRKEKPHHLSIFKDRTEREFKRDRWFQAETVGLMPLSEIWTRFG